MKQFKQLILLALFLLSIGSSWAKVVVFSDIDDTIKKANSMGGVLGAIHFFRKKVYKRTRDLFQELESYHADDNISFYYVSAAPEISFDAQKWLLAHQFPQGPSYLRRIDSGQTYDYKFRTIRRLLHKEMDKNPAEPLKVYFFGDNSSKDPKVYTDVVYSLGLEDAHIFIRDVSTKARNWDPELEIEKLDGINYFFSEMELLEFDEFSFVSEGLKERTFSEYKKKTLVPYYTQGTLVKRIERINQCTSRRLICKSKALLKAKKYWKQYHGLY